jgi:hypothetical protein
LRALETGPNEEAVVQTDGPAVRARYLAKLSERATHYREVLARHGGTLVRAVTTDDPIAVVRDILRAIAMPAEGADMISGRPSRSRSSMPPRGDGS